MFQFFDVFSDFVSNLPPIFLLVCDGGFSIGISNFFFFYYQLIPIGVIVLSTFSPNQSMIHFFLLYLNALLFSNSFSCLPSAAIKQLFLMYTLVSSIKVKAFISISLTSIHYMFCFFCIFNKSSDFTKPEQVLRPREN